MHPDLVKTEKEKLEKEILMKRLTLAWENRDYLELIILQQIIDVENTIAIEFSEKNNSLIFNSFHILSSILFQIYSYHLT